ncbi:hypothetical protein FRAHR75_1030003 [Frankia sp. Hr75.2]|nr:hypothetical protein FRAHR75_1030003 [Frankia sp. Hr75.2]
MQCLGGGGGGGCVWAVAVGMAASPVRVLALAPVTPVFVSALRSARVRRIGRRRLCQVMQCRTRASNGARLGRLVGSGNRPRATVGQLFGAVGE